MCPQDEEERRAMSQVPYREAIGSLLFAAIVSRPDIAFAVSKAAKFVENPGKQHWNAVKRIFRYLRGTQEMVISYKRGNCLLTGYTDADWGSEPSDRKSTTGYVFVLNNGPVVWQSRTQTSVATSTLEAEYMAMADATKEAIWLRQLLKDLKFEQQNGTVIRVDNQAAIKLSLNPEFHNRSKHIDIRFHFLRDEVQKGKVVYTYVSTTENPADALTKGLGGPSLENCLTRLNLSTTATRV